MVTNLKQHGAPQVPWHLGLYIPNIPAGASSTLALFFLLPFKIITNKSCKFFT